MTPVSSSLSPVDQLSAQSNSVRAEMHRRGSLQPNLIGMAM
jgi:hypothetical protein